MNDPDAQSDDEDEPARQYMEPADADEADGGGGNPAARNDAYHYWSEPRIAARFDLKPNAVSDWMMPRIRKEVKWFLRRLMTDVGVTDLRDLTLMHVVRMWFPHEYFLDLHRRIGGGAGSANVPMVDVVRFVHDLCAMMLFRCTAANYYLHGDRTYTDKYKPRLTLETFTTYKRNMSFGRGVETGEDATEESVRALRDYEMHMNAHHAKYTVLRGSSMYELDDHMVNHRVGGQLDTTSARNTDKKKNGVTINVMANRALNMVTAFSLQTSSGSLDCTKRMIRAMSGLGTYDDTVPDVYCDCDRAYLTAEYQRTLREAGMLFGGTMKRKSGHSHTYVDKGQVMRRENAELVQRAGAAAGYYAQRVDNTGFTIAMRQGNGSSQVCLMATNVEAHVGKWSFDMPTPWEKVKESVLQTYFPGVRELTATQGDCFAWYFLRRGIITSTTSVQFLRIIKRYNHLEDFPKVAEILELAQDSTEFDEEGGRPLTVEEWRALPTRGDRKKAFSRLTDHQLGQWIPTDDDEGLLLLDQLKRIARAHSVTSGGLRKGQLANAIRNDGGDAVGGAVGGAVGDAVDQGVAESTELRRKMLATNYMAPVSKGSAAFQRMKIGHANEAAVVRQLTSFVEENAPHSVSGIDNMAVTMSVVGVDTGGLVVNREHTCIGTSVDAAASLVVTTTPQLPDAEDAAQLDILSVPDGSGASVLHALSTGNVRTNVACKVVCEFKTATVQKTIDKATQRLAKVRAFTGKPDCRTFVVFVGFDAGDGAGDRDGTSLLFKVCPEASHRVQLLHHCAVTGASGALYVMAKRDAIMYSVLVFFHEDIISQYRGVMVQCFDKLGPMYDTHAVDGVQAPQEPDLRSLGNLGYAVDRITLLTNHLLRDALYRMVLATDRPLPKDINNLVCMTAGVHNGLKWLVDAQTTQKQRRIEMDMHGIGLDFKVPVFALQVKLRNAQATANLISMFKVPNDREAITTANDQIEYVDSMFNGFRTSKQYQQCFNNQSSLSGFLNDVIHLDIITEHVNQFVNTVEEKEEKGDDARNNVTRAKVKMWTKLRDKKIKPDGKIPKKLQFYDSEQGREMRTAVDGTLWAHASISLGAKKRTCLLCKRTQVMMCDSCNVALCTNTCHLQWHVAERVTPLHHRRRSSGEDAAATGRHRRQSSGEGAPETGHHRRQSSGEDAAARGHQRKRARGEDAAAAAAAQPAGPVIVVRNTQ